MVPLRVIKISVAERVMRYLEIFFGGGGRHAAGGLAEQGAFWTVWSARPGDRQ